jgi:short-subunit dehydrogenase
MTSQRVMPRTGRLKLKPVSRQVIVITGATSGIGLSTARAAAARGATLMLVARNEEALKAVCEDLSGKGAKVAWCVADVGDEAQVRAVAQATIDTFGGFDTWVNNAGVAIYGALDETSIEDQRRLFDTNYWGVVYGSLAAVEHLRARDGGGAVINIGAVIGDMALPLQGAYAASKHAVKAFTNALRMEMMEEHAPVSVTLIKPSAVDTPYKEHARNLTGAPIKNASPVYATPLAAQAILYAAEHHVRELNVGAGGQILALAGMLAPSASEPLLAFATPRLSRDKRATARPSPDNLHHAGSDLRERSFHPNVRESSLYSTAQMRPVASWSLVALVALGAAAAFTLGGRRRVVEGDQD